MNKQENGQLKSIEDKIDKLLRFAYGDPENKVDGQIQKQEKDEQRLDELEIDTRPVRIFRKN